MVLKVFSWIKERHRLRMIELEDDKEEEIKDERMVIAKEERKEVIKMNSKRESKRQF